MLLLVVSAVAQSPPPSPGPMWRFFINRPPMLPPAIGPACTSMPLPSPDNHCEVHYVLTRGEGWNAQTRGELRCAWEDSGTYQEEIIRVFSADGPLPLRWVDANTVEIGLPAGARFTPPREKVEHFGHTVRYVYRPTPKEESGPLQCFEPGEDYRKSRTLSGPEVRNAHQAGWVSYGSEQTCSLVGLSISGDEEHAIYFSQTAMARLPYGTTDLVLALSPRTPQELPQVRLAPNEAPLKLQPGGPGALYRLVGPPAQRVLQQLSAGGTVELLFGTRAIEVTHNELPAAAAAFGTCVSAFRSQ
jgi:hypothetical protein